MMDKVRTGLEILKDPSSTAGEIADILAHGHPPFYEEKPVACCHISCRDCWLAWLTTGKPPIAPTRTTTRRHS